MMIGIWDVAVLISVVLLVRAMVGIHECLGGYNQGDDIIVNDVMLVGILIVIRITLVIGTSWQ